MMRSLRTRLLAGIIGGMILLLIVFSLLIYGVIRSTLIKQFDTSLASVAQILAASVEIDANGVEVDIEVQQMPEFTNPVHPMNYQIWNPYGQAISRSPLLGTGDLPFFHGSIDKPVFKVFPGPENHPYRAAGTTFLPRIDTDESNNAVQSTKQSLILVVTRDAHGLYGQLNFLKWLLFGAASLNAGLALIIGTYVVRRGLHPLNTIAAEIAAISEDSLTTRITAQRVPTEIAPIKSRLNELLSRLQTSFDRERQFNADIAHELRTPLAGIRSTIEVALARSRDAAEYRTALWGCLEIAKNMESVVINLLMLARLEAQQIGFKSVPVRLSELIDSVWCRFSKKADGRKLIFNNQIAADLMCQTDPDHLSMVLANLLDNAVEYTNEGGQILTTAQRIVDSVEIAVSNTGCKLTAEQVSKVSDCFWRGDSSRSDAGIHCGLGLTLVQRIVKALGGTFSIQLEQGGTFMTKVTLPAESQKTIPA
jgi:signal transduction histidine kinase